MNKASIIFFFIFSDKRKEFKLTKLFQISNNSWKHMKGVQLTRKLYTCTVIILYIFGWYVHYIYRAYSFFWASLPFFYLFIRHILQCCYNFLHLLTISPTLFFSTPITLYIYIYIEFISLNSLAGVNLTPGAYSDDLTTSTCNHFSYSEYWCKSFHGWTHPSCFSIHNILCTLCNFSYVL